ncbi:MAG: DMT family transporter [Rhodocyclaceae bacterium]|nr:MAG: DMT family transporter [Rhodocyclaceae bacterium]
MQSVYPYLFVFLWSTGFIGAKYGLPHAEPLTFLLVRYLLVIALMTLAAVVTKAPWPKDRRHWFHIGVSGVLMHAVYLGGVFTSIGQGLPAGVSSLVVGMQPLLTAVGAGWVLGERVLKRQWLGLLLGLVGTVLVLSGRIKAGFGLEGLSAALFALAGITVGTLYQKRFCPSFDWRTGAVAQFIPAALATFVVASFTESFHVEFAPQFIFALAWLVIVLSLGAISLLNHLIRSGTAVNVVSLFYLVPACTAAIAWLLFGEVLSGVALAGMGLAIWGVYLARK